jgi:large subunit ribosomal protein L22
MSITIRNRKVGISASKVRLVANLIRRKRAEDALSILRFCPKKEIAITITKLINSGLSIANTDGKYDLDNLFIDQIMVDEGRTAKRIRPRAQGRAFRIRKRSSHITISLKEK